MSLSKLLLCCLHGLGFLVLSFLGNENARESATCIHKDLRLADAFVTHDCQRTVWAEKN